MPMKPSSDISRRAEMLLVGSIPCLVYVWRCSQMGCSVWMISTTVDLRRPDGGVVSAAHSAWLVASSLEGLSKVMVAADV